MMIGIRCPICSSLRLKFFLVSFGNRLHHTPTKTKSTRIENLALR